MSSSLFTYFLLYLWIFIMMSWNIPYYSRHISNYKMPFQINYSYTFGSLAMFMFSLQTLTGLFLALSYINNIDLAFDSVQFIMSTTVLGYLFQALHSTGASIFLMILFFHLLSGLWYKLYKKEHSMIWCSGVFLLILVMLTSFTGYMLPWGQMSYWAATVIFNFFSILPLIGQDLVNLLFGGEVVGQSTLSRIYVLHFLVPFIILILMLLHMMSLHKKGSFTLYYGNNTTVSLKKFMLKDFGMLTLMLIMYLIMIYAFPNTFVDFLNLEKANGMVTPKHIKPEWYFMPFYGILKTIPHKAGGIMCMGLSIMIFLLIPFIYSIKLFFITNYQHYFNYYKILYNINFINNNSINNSMFIRSIYFMMLIILLISLGFFNDLVLGPYYIMSYFMMMWLMI